MRFSTSSVFSIAVLFLAGFLNSSACSAHEIPRHKAKPHPVRHVVRHIVHHRVVRHPVVYHHVVYHHPLKKEPPRKILHREPLHHAPAIHRVAVKSVIPSYQEKIREEKIREEKIHQEEIYRQKIDQENKEREIRVADIREEKIKEMHIKEARWHRYWVEHREAGRRWVAAHHIHNPHLIRRSIVFASTTEHGIVALVHSAVASMHHSVYRYGGSYFNMSRGIYDVDCSDYVDNLLKISQPRAYADLTDSMGTERPTTSDYYRFFNDLPEDPRNIPWQRVNNVQSLRPGDILVFRNHHGGGHVMVVMDQPTPARGDAYMVQVSDSASARHSDDTRAPHVSGVGIGTMMLKANPETGKPDAYAWTVDSGWDPVRIAMAEPLNT